MPKKLLIVILITTIFFALVGCSSAASYNDIESEPSDYLDEEMGEYTSEEIISAYSDGWNDASEEVFNEHNELYYDDVQYSLDDYYGSIDGEPFIEESYPNSDYPYTEASLDEAINQGREDALDLIFIDTDVLCHGEERYFRSDY